jgi:hypothetical protein
VFLFNPKRICLGASSVSTPDANYENSTNVWVLRNFSGELYDEGVLQSLKIDKVKVGDEVTFWFDRSAKTLSIRINAKCFGVCFTDVITPDGMN